MCPDAREQRHPRWGWGNFEMIEGARLEDLLSEQEEPDQEDVQTSADATSLLRQESDAPLRH
jgi:hypothetical protein